MKKYQTTFARNYVAFAAALLVLLVSLSVATNVSAIVVVETFPVADYRDDFQGGTPAPGWEYQWNSGGAIGTPANYSDLMWTGSNYDSNGAPGLPDPSPANFVFLGATGGHPGQQSGGGNAFDRYAIAGFTVGLPGDYDISDSFISKASTNGDGVELLVFVNSLQILGTTVSPGGTVSFDTLLGSLNAGDTIFAAAGPINSESFDSFTWDFTINRLVAVPEPGSLLLVGGGLVVLAARRRRKRIAAP